MNTCGAMTNKVLIMADVALIMTTVVDPVSLCRFVLEQSKMQWNFETAAILTVAHICIVSSFTGKKTEKFSNLISSLTDFSHGQKNEISKIFKNWNLKISLQMFHLWSWLYR